MTILYGVIVCMYLFECVCVDTSDICQEHKICRTDQCVADRTKRPVGIVFKWTGKHNPKTKENKKTRGTHESAVARCRCYVALFIELCFRGDMTSAWLHVNQSCSSSLTCVFILEWTAIMKQVSARRVSSGPFSCRVHVTIWPPS